MKYFIYAHLKVLTTVPPTRELWFVEYSIDVCHIQIFQIFTFGFIPHDWYKWKTVTLVMEIKLFLTYVFGVIRYTSKLYNKILTIKTTTSTPQNPSSYNIDDSILTELTMGVEFILNGKIGRIFKIEKWKRKFCRSLKCPLYLHYIQHGMACT